MTLSPEQEASRKLEDSLRAGDLNGVMEALGTDDLHDARDPLTWTPVLGLAIAWSPPSFISLLLEQCADPNFETDDGFPSLLAAIDRAAADRAEVMKLLIDAGAGLDQRGINDYTPLHHAAARGDRQLVELLLAHGADPHARTRIDDLATPADEAERGSFRDVVAVLRTAMVDAGNR